MFLSVFAVWMEKVASVNCVWAWMGGMGKGGGDGKGAKLAAAIIALHYHHCFWGTKDC